MAEASGTTKPDRAVTLTRYLIYKTEDEGVTLHLVGAELAGASDDARRLFFAHEENAELEGHYTAISVNAARIKPRFSEKVVKVKDGEPIEVEVPSAGAAPVAPVAVHAPDEDDDLESDVVARGAA